MKKPILNTRGGEFDYSAPTLEILYVNVEQGFATSPGDTNIYDDWGYDDEAGSLFEGDSYDL
ncbi:hypothetical protein [uncultured Alistipes sp.]|uniref:hypothetical protein n=1 Tax=uncultured Alistipes sp. TaxID=538949 RepID=UPI00266589D4|nr:hypothetical protein [uncultured Alistipes sp.]